MDTKENKEEPRVESLGLINSMVTRVTAGHDPDSVWETSMRYGLGNSVKVNKATTAREEGTGNSVSVPEGTVVTISNIGGGKSGLDHVVRLPDGRNVTVPFADLGEAFPDSTNEELVGSVTKVVLSKPLPQSAIDWITSGYMDLGVELPSEPEDDSATSMSFLMKGEDQEMLDFALEDLKKVAGTSFKSSKPASLNDWNAIAL